MIALVITLTAGWWLIPAVVTLLLVSGAVAFAITESGESGFFEVWPLLLLFALLVSGCAWSVYFAIRYFQLRGAA